MRAPSLRILFQLFLCLYQLINTAWISDIILMFMGHRAHGFQKAEPCQVGPKFSILRFSVLRFSPKRLVFLQLGQQGFSVGMSGSVVSEELPSALALALPFLPWSLALPFLPWSLALPFLPLPLPFRVGSRPS